MPGDEIAQTHYGNNNWYGHDDNVSHVHWDAADQPARAALLRFSSELIRFRRECPLLRRSEFLRWAGAGMALGASFPSCSGAAAGPCSWALPRLPAASAQSAPPACCSAGC
jgi:hypothetical protein